ncbi:MAG: MBL fold metallo-hydrolase [Myxococcota bacterium]
MKIHVLGSSAGGGLPQWNCGGTYSTRARQGDRNVPPRTQPSIAVSASGERWSVVNASPDIRDQFARFSGLHPRPGTRELPLDKVIITNADLDHTLGLLVLREALSYRIVSTPWVREAMLENNAAWRLLETIWDTAEPGTPFALDARETLEARFFSVPGKVPTYLKGVSENAEDTTVGLSVLDTERSRRLVYAAGIKVIDGPTRSELERADCRFVDGTFFSAEELLAMRPDAPDAHAMGHQPVGGTDGSLKALSALSGRSIYIHINNTNPLVDAGSPEAREVEGAGVEIASDGMEIEL